MGITDAASALPGHAVLSCVVQVTAGRKRQRLTITHGRHGPTRQAPSTSYHTYATTTLIQPSGRTKTGVRI